MSGLATSQLGYLKDFVMELKRHTKGRRAVHVHVSRLERHHQEAVFRREAAVFIKSLIDKFPGSRNFSLSNHDFILVTNGASLDDIEPLLVKIRKIFKDDPLILSLDPIQGQSDNFTVCYNLVKEFDGLVEDIKGMLRAEKSGRRLTETIIIEPKPIDEPVISNMADAAYSAMKKPKKTVTSVKIERTDANIEMPEVPLDLETISKLEKFISAMDISAYVRPQNIIAIVGKGKPTVAMIERSARADEVVAQLIQNVDMTSNVWLRGYLDDLIADRMILSNPELQNKKSLASIVPLTISTILGPHFAAFEQGHKNVDKSAVVIEISLMDVLVDSARFEAAQSRARLAGYKLAIGHIDPYVLSILDSSLLEVDFFKVNWRSSVPEWLDGINGDIFKQTLARIGLPRVIISHCNSDEAITTMRALGATLFIGSAVDGYKP